MNWFLNLFREHRRVLSALAQARLDQIATRAAEDKAIKDATAGLTHWRELAEKAEADLQFFKSWCAKLETRLEDQIKEHRADLHKLSDWQGLVTTGRTVFNAVPAMPERPPQHLEKVQPRPYAGDVAKEQTRKFNAEFFAKEQEEYHHRKNPTKQPEVEAVPV